MNNSLKIKELLQNAEPQLTLDPLDPMKCARALVNASFTNNDATRTLHRYRGDFWRWSISHYRASTEEVVRSEIWQFLDKAFRADKEGRLLPFRPTRSIVANVLDALSAVCQLDASIDPPAWLVDNKQPPANEYVAVANGLLHLKTRELSPPTPTYFGVSASTVRYDPAAPEPRKWIAFLKEGLEDDTAISLAQEWFGYSLAPDTSQQKILLCIGPKRAGKGTLARVLTSLVGRSSVSGPTMGSLATNFGLEPLIDKPLAIVSDARIGQRTDKSVIVERLLSISGEDTLTVDRKFKLAWSGRLPTRFVILTNEMPSLTDGSGALVGRFLVLLFKKSFYGKENVGLTDELLDELPSILNWAIEGYERLLSRGYFEQPKNAKETIEAMEALGSPIKAFIAEECIVGPTQEVEVDLLYTHYCTWCEKARLIPRSKQWFGRDLSSALPGLKTRKPRSDDARKLVYVGIGEGPY
ncbi:NTP-binding protein [Bradyrhizobium sp. 147]|uniref:DNA primase family protein n=1 Tax=Bradyrhizobium sp. 147 TaxID=2782623 RepID=UPI001FFA1102|nr:DNA primase family protein [Bradyrhizobium sp. 147]MCK1679407.1 NTP-binding protein [Bradyrhizobium sp. 147]